MTTDSEYNLVIWDGKSKGSYKNILRAIKSNKKIKVYLFHESDNRCQELKKVTNNEIERIFRQNNGYNAREVVEYLKSSFKGAKELYKYLVEHHILKKDGNIYHPIPQHEKLFFISKYKGKVSGVKFKKEFIDWGKKRMKEKPAEQQLNMF